MTAENTSFNPVRLLVLFILLIFVGLGGGYVTKLINRSAAPVWAAMVPSVLSGLLWGFMARQQTGLSLSLLSIMYDITYAISYVVVFVMMGDKLTPLQVLGFFVALSGVAMMSK